MFHPAGTSAVRPTLPASPGRRQAGTALLNVVSVGVAWAAGAAVFFRAQLASGFDRNMGDNGDTRLIIYLCEHWYLLLQGRGAWRNLAFFYPVKGLLGWSDAYLLYEIFYTPLRLVGCDPFLAFQLTLVLLSAVGFASFVALVRVALGAPLVVALIGGLLFAFSNALWLHVSSPQLLGVYFVPVILLLGLSAGRALPRHPRRSAALAAAAGLVLALLFYSTYYVAWFSTLAAGVAIVVLALSSGRPAVAASLTALRTAWRSVMAAGAGFALGVVPFALTYIPVLNQFGGLSYAQALGYAPRWRELADIGRANLVWRGVIRRLVSPKVPTPYELTFAITPVLLTLAVVGGVIGVWRLRTRTAVRPAAARSAAVLSVTALILSVLPVKTRFGSLWFFVWRIPGATAIRAIDRIQVVTGLTVSLSVVAAATELTAALATPRLGAARHGPARRSRLVPVAGVVLLLFAVVEQLNTQNQSLVNRPAQLAFLRAAAPPPPACRSFFVVDSSPRRQPLYSYQIDAMLVSQKVSLPTLNGYTARDPVGWELKAPYGAGYRTDVAAWADRHGVRAGLCQLDLAGMRWTTSPDLPTG